VVWTQLSTGPRGGLSIETSETPRVHRLFLRSPGPPGSGLPFHCGSYRGVNYPGRNYRGEKQRAKTKGMKVDKISISFDAGLGDQVRDAARKAGTGLSSWLAGAAAAKTPCAHR
jgi:hypothetical protein